MKECCNCRSTQNIKVHYIVPLVAGGNDIDSNRVHICNKCYNLIPKPTKNTVGRDKIELEDVEDTLRDWFYCKIGTKEAKKQIGISSTNQSTWSRLKKEYSKKHNIVDNRNNIDLLIGCGYGILGDRTKGYIKYKGKDKEKL